MPGQSFILLTPGARQKVIYTETNLKLSAAGLLKYV